MNYNQVVRAANAAAKYGGAGGGNGKALPSQEMDRLKKIYDQATQRIGTEMYRILG